MRILLIEDEDEFALFLKKGLEAETFAVDLATSGAQGLKDARLNDYDLVLLDLGLPDMHGAELAAELRRHKRSLPIIALTGKYLDDTSEIDMLDVCDDFVPKPILKIKTLLARIRAVLRRPPVQHDATLKVGDLKLNAKTHTVARAGKPIHLPPKQFAVLEYLMRHAGQVVSRAQLLEHAWSSQVDPFTNTVDVHVRELRKRIASDHKQQLIHTVPRYGYKITA